MNLCAWGHKITWQHGDGDISPLETGDSSSGDRFRAGPHPYHRQRPWLVRQSDAWSLNTVLWAASAPGCKQHLSGKPGLPPQSYHHFAWKPSARVSQTIRPFYLSHMIAAVMSTDEYRHLHRSECRNTLIISLGSVKLPAPEAGDIVEIFLL